MLYACYVRNRCPTSALDGGIPYEVFSGRQADTSMLKPFGVSAHVHVPDVLRTKLDVKAEERIFVGIHNERKAYQVYLPHSKQIVYSRDVVFGDDPTEARELVSSGSSDHQLTVEHVIAQPNTRSSLTTLRKETVWRPTPKKTAITTTKKKQQKKHPTTAYINPAPATANALANNDSGGVEESKPAAPPDAYFNDSGGVEESTSVTPSDTRLV